MKILLLLICAVLLVNLASAQWVTNGPSGKIVNYISSSGSDIFAATQSEGLYLSTDKGNSWTAVDNGFADGSSALVYCVATSGSNIFAGTSKGLYLSTDNCASWALLSNAYTDSGVYSLAFNGSTLYAGGYGAFESINNGSSWTAISNGIGYVSPVTSLIVSGSNMYAETYSWGVSLSKNNGSNWYQCINGLTLLPVFSFTSSDTNIYAGLDGGGVFLSTVNDTNWRSISAGVLQGDSGYVFALAANNSYIFAGTSGGLFYSANNGNSWTLVPLDKYMIGVNALAISDSILYVGTDSGVWQESLTKITAGIQQITKSSQSQFNLYPNPANSSFTVQQTSTNEKQLLQLFDITGNLILSQNIYNSKTIINAGNLPDGIYTVRIESNEGVATNKLAIVK